MPGLINTHTHAPMVLYRGLADDLALMEWLQKYIFPAEAKTVSPGVRARRHPAGGARDDPVRARRPTRTCITSRRRSPASTKEAGLRGVLGQTIIQFPVADAKTPAEGAGARRGVHQGVRRRRADHAGASRRTRCTRSTPRRCKASRALADRAARAGHHPSRRDRRTRSRPSRRQAQDDADAFLESLGFWGPRTLAAHAVWLDAGRHRRSSRARHVGVAHNPESNMKLASGIAPVDGDARGRASPSASAPTAPPATTTSTCSRRCARPPSCTSCDAGDPRALSGADGARDGDDRRGAARSAWTSEIGSLEPGKRADLIVVSMAAARQTPMYDPVSHLVYVTRGDDVRTTIVNGRVLMRDRQGADAGRAGTCSREARGAAPTRSAPPVE